MQTRTPAGRALLPAAAFSLACVLIGLFLWHTFGGSFPLQASGYRFSVVLPQATDLQPDADARIAGINVGHVVSVNQAGPGARVVVTLDSQYAPLRSDARVLLRNKSLLGEAFLELTPGSRAAPAIPDGGALAERQVIPQQRIDDYLSAFDPATRQNIRLFLQGFAAGLQGRVQDLNNAIGSAVPLGANLNDLLTQLNAQRGTLQQAINTSGQVLEDIGQRQGALQAAITQGDRFFGVSAQRDRQVTQIFHALPPFLSQLTATAHTAQAASGDLQRAATSLQPVAPLLAPALAETRAAAPAVRDLFAALPATQSAGVRDLPELDQVLGAAHPAVAQLYPAARQLIPLLDLTGQNIEDVIGPLANFGAVTNGYGGGEYDAQGAPAHFARSETMWWNESIAGYEKPPPTNRQNAYPAPGSLVDVDPAKGGLKAWTCANLSNQELIPPFGPGAGAPPCKVQGPWTFEAHSAYFPRLYEAPP